MPVFVSERKIPVIVGPTASRKTELSLELAKLVGGEIVSADSRQVYKYLDIGTAKPTPDQQAEVPHHFIDIRLPDEYYSAGEYGREAKAQTEDILKRGLLPIVVGGSGLYIRALVDGLFGPRTTDPEVKRRLRERAAEEGPQSLFAYLHKVDPLTANRLHVNDAQRIIRALEVYEITGVPISHHHAEQEHTQRFNWHFVSLEWYRHQLYKRIEVRVDTMIEGGLVDEVRDLHERGYSADLNSLRTVGYKEIFSYLSGILDLPSAIAEIKKHTRNYAKRQITWFKRDRRVHWHDIGEETNLSALAHTVVSQL